MQRHIALQKLSREHHDSLVMAQKILRTVKDADQDELNQMIDIIREYYENELEAHFQHEEQAIFATLFKHYRQHIDLATVLLKEHGYLRILVQRIKPDTARADLQDFATVLKNHTRIEERELFPLIEELFSEDQFNAVVNFTPLE